MALLRSFLFVLVGLIAANALILQAPFDYPNGARSVSSYCPSGYAYRRHVCGGKVNSTFVAPSASTTALCYSPYDPTPSFGFQNGFTTVLVDSSYFCNNCGCDCTDVSIECIAVADTSSLLWCASSVVNATTGVSCQIQAQRVSQVASDVAFDLSTISLTVQPASVAVLNYLGSWSGLQSNLSFVLMPTVTSCSLLSVTLSVSGQPAFTQYLTISSSAISSVRVGQPFSYTLIPRANGFPVLVNTSSLNLNSSLPGTFLVSPAPSSTVFNVNFTASQTGLITLTDGWSSPRYLQSYEIPDNTSTLSCPSFVLVNTPLVCTLQPRRASVSIPTLASLYNIVTSGVMDARLDTLLPSFGSTLTLTFQMGSMTGVLNVADGLGNVVQVAVYGVAASNTALLHTC
eukprot:TRINITY_DN14274_c0_g1_i5.p1 TRINITY_DN14274_c0_g1~~TRINITY_DN14274_c0_g1_i5.p1  ORF type:complete len:401 (+),score=111.66 TRINITY_DN14274_c0_g1_i5:57-1259(+)